MYIIKHEQAIFGVAARKTTKLESSSEMVIAGIMVELCSRISTMTGPFPSVAFWGVTGISCSNDLKVRSGSRWSWSDQVTIRAMDWLDVDI